MRENTVIIIAGPTGSGKTELGARLAALVDGEIISADSRQIYRSLDIGTNKSGTWDPRTGTRTYEGIPQYLTDIIDPPERFSAGAFATRAIALCNDMFSRKKQPIIVGGTGLYLQALVTGLAPVPDRDENLFVSLKALLAEKGPEHLYQLLLPVDPATAVKNRYNPQRLLRSIELWRLTGAPPSMLAHHTIRPTDFHFVWYALDWPRQALYDRLDRRTIAMFETGFIEETRRALESGCVPTDPGMESIGYRLVIRLLAGQITRTAAIAQTQRDTRHYAKRQGTWFRRIPDIQWLPIAGPSFDPAPCATQIARAID